MVLFKRGWKSEKWRNRQTDSIEWVNFKSLQSIHYKKQFRRAIHSRISTSSNSTSSNDKNKTVMGEMKIFETPLQTISSQNDSLFRCAPIGSYIAKYLIQIRTLERRSLIIWFWSGLRSGILRHVSDRDFGVPIANNLIQMGTSERGSLII